MVSVLPLLCSVVTLAQGECQYIHHSRAVDCDMLFWNRKLRKGWLLFLWIQITRLGAKLLFFLHPKLPLPSKQCMAKPLHWLIVHSGHASKQRRVLVFIERIILNTEFCCSSGLKSGSSPHYNQFSMTFNIQDSKRHKYRETFFTAAGSTLVRKPVTPCCKRFLWPFWDILTLLLFTISFENLAEQSPNWRLLG